MSTWDGSKSSRKVEGVTKPPDADEKQRTYSRNREEKLIKTEHGCTTSMKSIYRNLGINPLRVCYILKVASLGDDPEAADAEKSSGRLSGWADRDQKAWKVILPQPGIRALGNVSEK